MRILQFVTAEEIKQALFDMAPYKSPGPDGIPAGFYQLYWQYCRGVYFEIRCPTLSESQPPYRNKRHAHRPNSQGATLGSLCNIGHKTITRLSNRLK